MARKFPEPGTAAYTAWVARTSPSVQPAHGPVPPPTLGHGESFKTWFWDKGIKQAAVQFVKGFDPRTREGQIALMSAAAGGADSAILAEGWSADALTAEEITQNLAKESVKPTPHRDLIDVARGKRQDISIKTASVRSARDIRERVAGGGQAGTLIQLKRRGTSTHRPITPGSRLKVPRHNV